jgi:hypothetical protein
MSEAQRSLTPSEPGHRYVPRQVSPRYTEVRASVHRSFTPVTPVVETKPPIEQPVVSPPTPSLSLRPDITPPKVPLTPVTFSKPRGNVKPAKPRLNRSLVLRRQMVDKASQYKRQNQDLRRRTIMAFAFGGMVATLLATGVFVFYSNNRPKQQVLSAIAYSPTPGGAVTSSKNIATASESAVSQTDIDNYKTSPDLPRVFRIPSLGVQARIYAVQSDMGGNPLPTNNIFDLGWLTTSAKPGESGAALISGYVDGATKPGALASISSLSVGDTIELELGSGSTVKFKVVSSRQYPAESVDMKAATTSAIAGRPGLNILTNTGRFDVRQNQFEPRTLVFTVLQ